VGLLRRALLFSLLLYIGAWGYRIYSRKYWYWLPAYLAWALTPAEKAQGPMHVFFLFTDHFEPGTEKSAILQRWLTEYPALAERHHDSAGRPVQHTWFYPAEQPVDRNLKALKTLVAGGYGEVELHLHHGPDTPESARRKYTDGIAWFQRYGFLKGIDGATHFAFIHGVWALDNSRNNQGYCGVDRELQLLRNLGCFADFTFPSLGQESQPAMVNSIYMAIDDEGPKSYNRGVPLQFGVKPSGDLLIFEGPLTIAPALDPKRLFAVVDDGDIHPAVPSGARRVDYWMRSNIHVKGRPDWQFIKVHAHGAQDDANATEALGLHFEAALAQFEVAYNDRNHYVLHYVTAREAYNLVRAAAAGKTGDPCQYYNYVIPPYEAGLEALKKTLPRQR
jgi:hypothetical protein